MVVLTKRITILNSNQHCSVLLTDFAAAAKCFCKDNKLLFSISSISLLSQINFTSNYFFALPAKLCAVHIGTKKFCCGYLLVFLLILLIFFSVRDTSHDLKPRLISTYSLLHTGLTALLCSVLC